MPLWIKRFSILVIGTEQIIASESHDSYKLKAGLSARILEQCLWTCSMMEEKIAATATVYCNYNTDSSGTAEALNVWSPEGFRIQETNIDLMVTSRESPTGQHSAMSEFPTPTSTRASPINQHSNSASELPILLPRDTVDRKIFVVKIFSSTTFSDEN